MAESNFARRMLEKQGWKDGDGLGRNRDGISKPIKVTLKQDKTGVGHDPGATFTDHWWLKVFNDAASSVTNTKEESEVKESPTPVNKLYQGFTKGSTLKQGKEEKDSDVSSDDEGDENQSSSDLPTLDDLHKYCGGATGHRAATLGIKMKGKIHRASEQERLFNEKTKNKNESTPDNLSNGDTDLNSPVKRKKKKKKHSKCLPETEEITFSTLSPETDIIEDHENKLAYIGNDLDLGNNINGVSENIQEDKTMRKKSKKKKRQREEEQDERDELSGVSTDCSELTSSKKKMKTSSNSEENVETVESNTNEKSKHKKKKKKHKNY